MCFHWTCFEAKADHLILSLQAHSVTLIFMVQTQLWHACAVTRSCLECSFNHASWCRITPKILPSGSTLNPSAIAFPSFVDSYLLDSTEFCDTWCRDRLSLHVIFRDWFWQDCAEPVFWDVESFLFSLISEIDVTIKDGIWKKHSGIAWCEEENIHWFIHPWHAAIILPGKITRNVCVVLFWIFYQLWKFFLATIWVKNPLLLVQKFMNFIMYTLLLLTNYHIFLIS